MFELSVLEWVIVAVCAMFIGFTKTGVSSLGILVVTVLMYIFPAKESVGILLPMLIAGDIFAVIYYRRNVVWKYLFSLIPWVLIGIVVGYYVLNQVNDQQLKPMIGSLVLALIILHIGREKLGDKFNSLLPTSLWFTLLMGILAGFTTMIGNAAGGVMAIYLLVKGLPKTEFVGTGAWFFLFVNIIKVPFYIHLGLITIDSFTFNLWLIPTIIIGAFVGVKVLSLIPQKAFQILILGFAAVGALRLLFV
ncbi:sulfite exporter TauE/SafE family protein [Aquibacillus salsiterrae]|uniref:Probable membrane transporter protein n=1 Tax=Aquibacillus salsiterrae TaxID=2950439 RepID=A0A9X3WH41_9BACI|nr:sulfite exporter TauE/SafE family protein [Aquibacillus salsiterrae]MDC3417344.1 sulfite exporter TauE/SafE family protein [Aquibacillus salsiterrae]